jgi:hypothetical protein
MVEHLPDDEVTPSRLQASPRLADQDFGLGGRIVGFIVFDILYRHFLLITTTVGGMFIGWGLDLTDRPAAWIVGSGGAAVGALLGAAMWLAGPGRKIAKLRLWVVGSAFLVVVWWFFELVVCAAIQKVLVLATGGWDVTPIGALLGGAVGFVLGGVAQELWWQQRRRGSSSARREAEQDAARHQPPHAGGGHHS